MSRAVFLIHNEMDKEKILPEIKKRIEAQGKKITLTDRTIEDYITKVISRIVKDDSELTDEFYNDHIDMLFSMNGQVNSEVASIVKEKGKNPNETQLPKITINPEIEELKKTVKQMQDEKESEKRKIEFQSRVNSARNFTKNEKWAKNEKVIKYAIELVPFEEEMTQEQYSEKCKKKYDELMTDFYGDGIAPELGGVNATPTISEEERDKAARERAQRTKNIIV